MKLIMLIKMCLNKSYSKVCIGKNLSYTFPIQNISKKMFYHHFYSTLC